MGKAFITNYLLLPKRLMKGGLKEGQPVLWAWLLRLHNTVIKSFLLSSTRLQTKTAEFAIVPVRPSKTFQRFLEVAFSVFVNDIFDALCKLSADSYPNVRRDAHLLDQLVKDIVTENNQFSIEVFITLLRERLNVLNPYVRKFLVGWITVQDSMPDIDMLGFLPDFVDGLFNMLSDPSHEIRQQADSTLSEFLLEIKNAPSVDFGRITKILVQRAGSAYEFNRLTSIRTRVNKFVKLGGD